MAFVDGADLREILRTTHTLEPERALALIGQVGEALDAAHAAGLVHRDVKPANILVAQDAQGRDYAYLCDFGLARHGSSAGSLANDAGFVGTIDYAPPEQLSGDAIDGRADVYSLACVLFECVAGERPFRRETDLAVVFAHLNEPPPELSVFRGDLPQALDGVFAKALAKEPDGRYATCAEFVAAVSEALRRRTRRVWRGRIGLSR